MSGALLLQQKSPRQSIRAEGEKRGFEGDDLDEFVEIVAGLEDIDWDESRRQQSQDIADAIKRFRQ